MGAPERRPRVLVVDDEEQIRRALRSILQARAYDVELAESAEAALEATAERTPDIVILDLTLPGISGLEATKELREWYHGPIIVLSVRSGDEDKIAALDFGADDYLTKPFSTGELLARVRALLRRTAGADTSVNEIAIGDVAVDAARREVLVRGETVHLTRTEFDILVLLMRNAGRVVTANMLLERVWGPEYFGDTQTLRAHVSHLRKKIERPGDVPRHVLTEPGVGFRFVGPDE
ncbi:MAG: response regulator transcription factor [Coriobacteriales bacterium]|nr:response regulator transcription factor [Coriobacteriales bacterium]